MIDYRIRRQDGFTEKIGELVSMLEHTRAVTLNEIAELKQAELDHVPNGSGNTIGALLMHIAAIEYVHQVISFERRDLNEEELLRWGAALELGDKAREEIKGKPVDYYLEVLREVREDTLHTLAEKDDSWLFEEYKWDNGVAHNLYYLWYHVMEDEISHRGQIRAMLRQMNL
ncbi:DinB family protein [Thalassobacillus hwangdonensis]|uniref:DinB family protein n=1 Tax=Thalassobacillus hwangdonensis TaxID=546108 RepID=A0ABW3L7V3_9BACI